MGELREAIFLDALRSGMTVSRAAYLSGWGRTAAYQARARRAEFAAQWDSAVLDGFERRLDDLDVDLADLVHGVVSVLRARLPELYPSPGRRHRQRERRLYPAFRLWVGPPTAEDLRMLLEEAERRWSARYDELLYRISSGAVERGDLRDLARGLGRWLLEEAASEMRK